MAVFDALRPGGIGVVADEPSELPEGAMARIGGMRLRVAGFSNEADLRPDGGKEGIRFRPDGSTEWGFRGVPIHLPLPGMHNVRNALLALGEEDAALLAEDPLLFPPPETADRLRSFANLPGEEEELYDEKFSEITGA